MSTPEMNRTEEQQQVIEALVTLDIASLKVEKFTFMNETDKLWMQSEIARLAARFLNLPEDEEHSDRPARGEVYENIRRRSLSPSRKASTLHQNAGRPRMRRTS